jgi:hypothetical protein
VRVWGLSSPDAQPPAHLHAAVSVMAIISPIAMVPTNFFDDSCDVKTVLQVMHSILSHTFYTECLPLAPNAAF